jgi:hypothetical protein
MAMSKSKWLILTFSLMAIWLLLAGRLTASLDSVDLSWHVIAGGGGRVSSAGYTAHGSVAQPIVGGSSGGNYQMNGGFWTFLGAQPTVPTPTGSPPPSTPTATPTGVPCPNILPDGDFEAGVQPPWGMAGGVQVTTARAHGGTHSVRLGGAHNAADELFGGVELPPTATSITLSYWWYVESTDPDPGADHLLVVLGTPGGETPIETITNLSPRNAWQRSAHDLSGYAGQNIGLTFHAHTDGADLTSFYVDDVEIRACGAPADGHHIYIPIVLKASSPS